MALDRPSLPLHIDSTMTICARSCMRKFEFEFCHGFRPSGLSVDLHAGACFALGLEETRKNIYKHKLPLDQALLRSHAAFTAAWGDFEIPEFKRTAKTFERTWETIEDYFKNYSPLTDHIAPYFNSKGEPTFEYTFAIPLEPFVGPNHPHLDGEFPEHPNGGPFIYTGRFDMLGSHHDRPIVCDEKTTGRSIGSEWARQWNLRNQFMGYVWACRQCGIPVDEVSVRGIAIQKTQIVHAEAIKTYSDSLIAKWHEQLRRDLWRIRRAHDEGYFDYNFGDTCTAYGNCVFMDACASDSPENWLSGFEVRHWNPLNKNPVEEPKT